MFHFDVRSIYWCFGTLSVHFQNTVRPRDTRPRDTWTSQVHVFELGPKKFEMNKFMKWKPWAAQFSDHFPFTSLQSCCCELVECRRAYFLNLVKKQQQNVFLFLFEKSKIRRNFAEVNHWIANYPGICRIFAEVNIELQTIQESAEILLKSTLNCKLFRNLPKFLLSNLIQVYLELQII